MHVGPVITTDHVAVRCPGPPDVLLLRGRQRSRALTRLSVPTPALTDLSSCASTPDHVLGWLAQVAAQEGFEHSPVTSTRVMSHDIADS